MPQHQYEVTIILHVALTTTVTVSAPSATQARDRIKGQWDAIGASLAHVSDSDAYAWDVVDSTMAIDTVVPIEATPPPF
jgi:hypothetical protein